VKKTIVILWASFLAAGVAEVLFFTVIDPGELFFLGRQVEFGPLATYSIGFLLFWLLSAAASALTCFLLRTTEEMNDVPLARR
jgi:hypothetical protein